jgi:UDP-N-acetylglucosamine--N-acetylmuramyl-(pentapeptide) pyrophosphoryl-undecaprenol N-acetylglucosamine transferase
LDKLIKEDVQLIWQTGKYYHKSIVQKTAKTVNQNIHITEFLNRMDLAYAAADVIISRAGAGTIAELCVIGKPVVLVPSPNVAEDHQTKNAAALVKNQAAILVADSDAEGKLVDTVLSLLKDQQQSETLGNNISKMALPEADDIIAKEVLKLSR